MVTGNRLRGVKSFWFFGFWFLAEDGGVISLLVNGVVKALIITSTQSNTTFHKTSPHLALSQTPKHIRHSINRPLIAYLLKIIVLYFNLSTEFAL